ncbi:hypothetical protein DXG03_004124 [Asterophora parasitica]|uniref:Uncharacterized protein n=1 Tax=Asterophora parasitica TaxID=117018 RepID=A0A9P7G708_9AGAR|nr:hypothetical protein DXG03_004124 [Asterophora parasitica]
MPLLPLLRANSLPAPTTASSAPTSIWTAADPATMSAYATAKPSSPSPPRASRRPAPEMTSLPPSAPPSSSVCPSYAPFHCVYHIVRRLTTNAGAQGVTLTGEPPAETESATETSDASSTSAPQPTSTAPTTSGAASAPASASHTTSSSATGTAAPAETSKSNDARALGAQAVAVLGAAFGVAALAL